MTKNRASTSGGGGKAIPKIVVETLALGRDRGRPQVAVPDEVLERVISLSSKLRPEKIEFLQSMQPHYYCRILC